MTDCSAGYDADCDWWPIEHGQEACSMCHRRRNPTAAPPTPKPLPTDPAAVAARVSEEDADE